MKMMMNKLVLSKFFFLVLSIKHLTPLYTTHSFLRKKLKCKAVEDLF